MNAAERWPALMGYIQQRNELKSAAAWCEQLRADEGAAVAGAFKDVAQQLADATAAYAAAQAAEGKYGYPYNSAMGEFLSLAINPGNHEPGHGYYMACQVREAYRLGAARRAVEAAIVEGKPLRIVAARDKKTRAPVRFYTFAGADQIKINGGTVECSNAKRRVRLSSNWSVSAGMEAVRRAIETGDAYGENNA
ncbi:MAG: hypothetical protein WC829_01025 [Hyphomicrobium sp.]|jgi:hypothetical protein